MVPPGHGIVDVFHKFNRDSKGKTKGIVLECYVQFCHCFHDQRFHVARQVMDCCDNAFCFILLGRFVFETTIQLNFRSKIKGARSRYFK